MMLEFKIDGAFSGRQRDLLYLLFPRNLVNLGDVLVQDSVESCQQVVNTHLTDKAVQELLPKLMAVRVPIQAMRFAERVELLDRLEERSQTQKKCKVTN